MEVYIVYGPGLNIPVVFSTHGKARAFKELLDRDIIATFVEKVIVNAATPEPTLPF